LMPTIQEPQIQQAVAVVLAIMHRYRHRLATTAT
jgi:hypothetical protein